MLNIKQLCNKLPNIWCNAALKNGILFSFFSFLNSGINFLMLIFIAGYISPDGYGKLNIFYTTVTLLTFLVHLNTQGIISVSYFRKSIDHLPKIINSVFLITLACFFFIGTFIFVFGNYISINLNIPVSLQYIALLISFFQLFSNVNLELWRLEEKPILYGAYSSSNVIGNFILTLVLVITLGYGWIGRVYSHLFIAFVFFIISFFFMYRRKYLKNILPSKNDIKEALSFGIPLIPHSASFWLRQGLDRYIINVCFSSSLVGLFSFSSNFANIIHIMGIAFNTSNSVFIYKKLSEEDNSVVRSILKKRTLFMILLYLCITIIACIISPIFVTIFYPEYIDSIVFIIPQCIGAMFQCFYLLFVNFLFYFKKTTKLMYITFGFSILHTLLSIILTKYSIYFTAYIGLFSNFLIALGVYLYSRKIYRLF